MTASICRNSVSLSGLLLQVDLSSSVSKIVAEHKGCHGQIFFFTVFFLKLIVGQLSWSCFHVTGR